MVFNLLDLSQLFHLWRPVACIIAIWWTVQTDSNLKGRPQSPFFIFIAFLNVVDDVHEILNNMRLTVQ